MGLIWQPWTAVSEGSTTPGAPIAAVPWGDSFALFISDPSGEIYAIRATPGYGWELVPGRSSKPGAPITALLSENVFTLFMADVTGEVFTTSGAPYQGWQPWTAVSEGSTTPGAPIAAVPWGDSFALFISDPSGGIYAIQATPGYGWELVPGRSSTPGGQIAVVPWYRPPSSTGSVFAQPQFLVFMVDVNGEVSVTSGLPYQNWDQWTSVLGVGGVPGALVTASPDASSSGLFSIFVADSGGEVRETITSGPPPAPWWEEPYGLETALQAFLLATPPYAAFKIYGGSDPTIPDYDRDTGTVPAPGIGLQWENLYQYLTWSAWAAQHAYCFVGGEDGNLWMDWSDGTDWYWTNQGAPQAGVAVTAGIGVITVMDSLNSVQRPYAYTIGSDGQLWINWWDYTRWSWTSLGTPQTGVTIAAGAGVLSVMNTPTSAQFPYAFLQGSDGQLWINSWDGMTWNWMNQATPDIDVTIASLVGVVTVMDSPDSAQRPYAFLIGSDGQLWTNCWDYTNFVWKSLGVPQQGVTATVGIGVLTVMSSPTSAQRPYAFVIGSDRQLWVSWWDDPAWHWSALGIPGPGITLVSAVGVTTLGIPGAAQKPAAFVLGSDGQLWWTYFDDGNGAWDWDTHGTPKTGVTIVAAIGVQTVMDSENSPMSPHVFVKGSDGQVWLRRSYDGGGWAWLAQGTPQGVGVIGGFGAIAKWSGAPFGGAVP